MRRHTPNPKTHPLTQRLTPCLKTHPLTQRPTPCPSLRGRGEPIAPNTTSRHITMDGATCIRLQGPCLVPAQKKPRRGELSLTPGKRSAAWGCGLCGGRDSAPRRRAKHEVRFILCRLLTFGDSFGEAIAEQMKAVELFFRAGTRHGPCKRMPTSPSWVIIPLSSEGGARGGSSRDGQMAGKRSNISLGPARGTASVSKCTFSGTFIGCLFMAIYGNAPDSHVGLSGAQKKRIQLNKSKEYDSRAVALTYLPT